MRIESESGQVMPMVTVMSLGLLVMVGLVIDAGVMFAARRDLQATADSAARAGASVIDEDAYRASDGQDSVLDPTGAELATHRRLHDVEVVKLSASPQAVFVRVARPQPLLILGFLGFSEIRVEADSTARPRTGILMPGS
ncbi:MAG: Tad domain-containing protein [Actinomycetota bacterium]